MASLGLRVATLKTYNAQRSQALKACESVSDPEEFPPFKRCRKDKLEADVVNEDTAPVNTRRNKVVKEPVVEVQRPRCAAATPPCPPKTSGTRVSLISAADVCAHAHRWKHEVMIKTTQDFDEGAADANADATEANVHDINAAAPTADAGAHVCCRAAGCNIPVLADGSSY